MAEKTPDTTSSEYDAMKPYWDMASDILGGAATMRNAGEKYLPKFEEESDEEYKTRKENAPFTPIYAEALTDLTSRPFAKECKVDDKSPADVKTLSENIDMRGNHLHEFARSMFWNGVSAGIDWILVTNPPAPKDRTLSQKDEQEIGARPYWVRVPAKRMLAVYAGFEKGVRIVAHARIDESVTEREGFSEIEIKRVRVFNRARSATTVNGVEVVSYGPPTWLLYEKDEKKAHEENKGWFIKAYGSLTVGGKPYPVIPLVPFVTGRECSASWMVEPPLRDLAYMQVEEYQQESNRKRVQTCTAFPMYAILGNVPKGPDGKQVKIPVGPRRVFVLPPNADGSNGDVKSIEPGGASGEMLRKDLEDQRREMREAGMQPLTPQSGNLTATASAVAAAKAHSAVQAWAHALKDALEQAWVLTGYWLGTDLKVEVYVYDDFVVTATASESAKTVSDLIKSKVISKREGIPELKRLGALSQEFDYDKNEEALALETEGLEPEEEIDPKTGLPLKTEAIAA